MKYRENGSNRQRTQYLTRFQTTLTKVWGNLELNVVVFASFNNFLKSLPISINQWLKPRIGFIQVEIKVYRKEHYVDSHRSIYCDAGGADVSRAHHTGGQFRSPRAALPRSSRSALRCGFGR
ncbi:hypothetical protein DCC62_12195 [candidate division KSB1 bacterium]|nr:hypothetical protein [candidate division KSB1 bacterium]RIK76035.1 MAG: hypothetical protein DCC62_12195 [candidate division KSB1 bacterium]